LANLNNSFKVERPKNN